MPDAVVQALFVAAALAVGAIPWALLATKWIAGVDVRTVGSGNVGATNASRVLGRKWFFIVFALDAGKGVAPVLLFPGLAGHHDSPWLSVGCGLAAVLGHIFNPFLHFKGGKGVATGAGAIAALAPFAALGALGVFGVVLLVFRYVSLASICGAAAIGPLALVFRYSLEAVVFAMLAGAVVVWRHRPNLARIAAGTEPRAFAKKETRAS